MSTDLLIALTGSVALLLVWITLPIWKKEFFNKKGVPFRIAWFSIAGVYAVIILGLLVSVYTFQSL